MQSRAHRVFEIAPSLFGTLTLMLLGGCAQSEEPLTRRVLLISCDTLRADRLGAYGYGNETSPRLDVFAREGVVFDEAYACAPMTQPSVSSLLTGQLPASLGVVPGNLMLLPERAETLAERISAAGFPTAAIVSNWILRRPHPSQGDIGVQQGFDHFDDQMRTREKNRAMFERGAKGTTNAAIAWLESHVGAQDDGFFLWVHYQDPHGPYTPPDRFARMFPGASSGNDLVPIGEDKLGHGQIPAYQALAEERDPAFYRARYDAEIRYFDAELGRLLEWLREHGLYDDALIVFTSDHGESLGEHDYWFCHGENLHREVARVPLVVRWPGGVTPAGYGAPETDGYRRCASSASHLDVAPSILAALGLAPARSLGRSLLTAAPPEGRVVPQDLLPEGDRPRWWAASDGHYRLLWSDLGPEYRLFDVRTDPAEEHDLAASDPDRVEHMLERYRAFVAREHAVLRGVDRLLSEEDGAALQALGYADGDEEN